MWKDCVNFCSRASFLFLQDNSTKLLSFQISQLITQSLHQPTDKSSSPFLKVPETSIKVTHLQSFFFIATFTLAIIDLVIYTYLLGICFPHNYVLHEHRTLILLLYSPVYPQCLAQHSPH